MGGKKQDRKSSKKSPKAASSSHSTAPSNNVPLQRPWITHGQDVSHSLQQQHWSWSTPHNLDAMSGYMGQSLIDEPYQAIHSVRSWPASNTSSGSQGGQSEAGATSGSR